MKMCILLYWFCSVFLFIFFCSFYVNLRLFICKKIAANIAVNEVFIHFTMNGPEVSD